MDCSTLFTFATKKSCLPLCMLTLLSCSFAVGKGRPRGQVRNGVYIVHPKKTVDRGAKRKPRVRRDMGGWRRSAIGPMDPYVRTAMQAITPSSAYGSRDPRRQSRFLGHIVDGTLGWATDIIHHIPIVGPLLGHPCRVVCRVVRAGENAVNAVTGTVGIHLFVILLLSCLCPATAITNCCQEDQVTYCTEVTCVHESGCVICEQAQDGVVCWEPSGLMVSHHPNYTGVDLYLTHHIDFVAGSIFICDLAGMREVCGAVTLIASYVVQILPRHVSLNTTADCYTLISTGVNPLFTSYFTWLAQEFNAVAAVVDFVIKLPVALGHALTQSHYISLAAIIGLALNGNSAKAIALLVLYVEAAAALPLTTLNVQVHFNSTCNFLSRIERCTNYTAQLPGSVYCFNPRTGFQEVKHYKPVDGWFCIGLTNKAEPTCCTIRTIPEWCGNCSTDCSWKDPRLTFEACGATPVLSTALTKEAHSALSKVLPTLPPGTPGVVSRSGFPTVVALLRMPGWPPFSEWKASFIQFVAGMPIPYVYNPERLKSLTYRDWARLPGTPPTYRGAWMTVPKGMYSSRRDISSGLITKDARYEDYQLLYSGTGAFNMAGITSHLLIIAILAALGARWCLLLYAVLNWLPSAFAFTPEIVAATAAAPWDDFLVRGGVYAAVVTRTPLSVPLSGSPVALCLTLFFHSGLAYTLQDVAVAVGSVAFFLAWAEFLTPLIPTMILTQSYLRVRLEAACHRWLDRSLMFVAVVVAPKAVWNTCLFLWACWLLLIIGGSLIVRVFGPKDKLSLMRMLQRCATAGKWLASCVRPIVVWAAGERGVFWFEHIDGKLEGDWTFRDPYYPFETEVAVAEDVGAKLACGDTIKGLPVYARAGSTVRAGIGQLPRGWKRTIPFSVKTTHHRNQLRSLALCLTGSDASQYEGSVFVVGTPLRSWMAFGCKGALYTAYHGARSRLLAARDGPRPPILVNKDKDLVKYPLPAGAQSMPVCTCSCTTFYLVTRLGNLVPVVRCEDRFVNTAPLTLKEAKGSSGAPIVCKCKAVKAMFVSCRSSRGVVSSLGVVMIDNAQEEDTRPVEAATLTPPTVPRQGKKIERLIAPTGSGKTTELPMTFYRDGYEVLVLNPSVATTRAIPKYMKEKYGITPNMRTGDCCQDTGSRLTYSTYGMFLTSPHITADVIICDEAHAVDPTTVLGIGVALKTFEAAPKGKLLILATATPPGTSMQPHPNITTITLSDDGDFPFHGKKIQVDKIRTGRHLVFIPGKKHCDTMAQDLLDLGINAVSYYRGKDANVIPPEGDVVVVATDALMTGYTGNFDSVYDSCLSVTPTYDVTMNPTFEVGVRTMNADAVTRMQRRGRTGRGKHGTYYQVTPHCQAHGVVPTANIIEAFDSGIAYFGMTPAEISAALHYFKDEPMTACLECSLLEIQNIFMEIGYVQPNYVEKMKKEAENYTYLYAAQYQLAKAENAKAPNDNPIWKGLNGNKPFPVLYDLEEYDPAKCECHSRAAQIAACFEEYFSSAVVTLAGVGLAAAAVFTAVDLLGNVVIKRAWKFTDDTTAARVVQPATDVTEALEECFNWDGFAGHVNSVSSWLADKLVELGIAAGGQTKQMRMAAEYLPHLLAGIQYFAGMSCLADAPALGSVLGFVGGVLSPLPLKANLFFTALGGAFAAKLTTQRGAAVFAAAGVLGAMTGGLGFGSIVGQALATYGGATASCLVALKLIDGQMPELSELASLALNLASPGSLIVGVGAALMVGYCTRTESQVWMNRLLAMLHRGSSCDEYYVTTTTLRKTIISLLESMNLWSVFKYIASWLQRQDEDLCTPRGRFYDFLDATGRVLRLIVEAVRGFVARVIKIPAVPIVGCTKGYNGTWSGSGIVNATCECGAQSTWNIFAGKATLVTAPKSCSAWWTRRVPINNAMVGCPRPRPAGWTTMAVNTGFNTYVTYERKGTDVYVTGVSNIDQVVEAVVPDLLSAVMVDGVQVKPFGGTDWKQCGPFYCRLRVGDTTTQQQIPFKIEPSREPFREVGCPVTARVMREVCLTERCVSLGKAVPITKQPGPRSVSSDGPKPRKKKIALSDDEIDSPADLMRSLEKGMQKLERMAPKEVSPVEMPAGTPPGPKGTIFFGSPKTGLDNPCFLADVLSGPDETLDKNGKVKSPKSPELRKRKSSPKRATPSHADARDALAQPSTSGEAKVVALCTPVPPGGLDKIAQGIPLEEVMPAAPIKRVSLCSQARPLPSQAGKGKPDSPTTYSIHSSSWSTCDESADESCSTWSYTWTVPQLVYKGLRRTVAAVSSYTFGIMRYKPLVYVTDPHSINERVKKVTILRKRECLDELKVQIAAAKRKARVLQERELSLDEALELTANRTAKSAVTGLTARDLKDGQTALVKEIYNNLQSGIAKPWNQVNIMPKSEVFVKTPQKPTPKPARIIAYPHLEMRVVEKMVLGRIGPATVKAVCGEAYGFVPPAERVQKLLAMWRSKDNPAGFTCDTVCFDSTITPEDVSVECQIYQEAAKAADTKDRIGSLHDNLYAGGPMVMQGVEVGTRHCRASGVFTTSSSNTMTCFLKVSAAAKAAGIRKPSWLICGDDCVCIFETGGEEDDKARLGQFALFMKRMGAPQGEVPRPYYHLELLDSCSSNVSVAQTTTGTFHYLTRDPRIPLARCSVEGKGFNPLGSMLGYIIANYPAMWVSRVIAVKFMAELVAQDAPERISFDWYGNNYSVPLRKIPYVIQALHGREAWHIRAYTSREASRVAQALKDNTIRPLRYYKRTARSVLATARKQGGVNAFLANTLLSWVHGQKVNLDPKLVDKARGFNPFEPYGANPWELEEGRKLPAVTYILLCAGVIAFAAFAVVALGY